ncbi:MAG: hypothetical protein BWY74_01327 [Firmicutes bacterium ADurb.Bin419]|nr:MAG: hypothetical protein BWY74_01327 [Firmicutes bacterium ADurb.Bin419]
MLYVYVGCLFFGILFSIISFLLDGHDFGLDGIDLDGGGDCPGIFSPLVLTSSITVFGGAGIVSMLGLNMGGVQSAVISLVLAAIIGAAIFFGVVRFAYNQQSNSTFSQDDLIGLDCEVVTPIPVKGMGEIVYIVNGERHSLPAKATCSDIISKGEKVSINEITGNAATVSRKVNISALDHTDMGNEDIK